MLAGSSIMKQFLRGGLSTLSYRLIRLVDGHPLGLRILMYHRVTDAHPTDRLCVPVAHFAEQVRLLRDAGYHSWTLSQAIQWMRETNKVRSSELGDRSSHTKASSAFRIPHSAISSDEPKKVIVMTFDDGFEDNFLFAHPMLKQYGMTGCFFTPVRFIEVGQGGADPNDRPMTWMQLRELVQAGHEVGAHSVSHRKLTLLSPEQMRWEISESKIALERSLQQPVPFFCYPSGDYNDAVKQAVIDSGYEGACTVEPGANGLGADPFALKRTEISAFDSLWDFQKKLAGAYDWLHLAVQGMQRVQGKRQK